MRHAAVVNGSRRWILRASTRVSLVALMAAAAAAAVAAPAAQASFGVSEANFEAGTCMTTSCTYASPHSDFYTQAAGHPPWGITTFELNTSEGLLKVKQPEGALKRIRVDVPPGLAADPEALSEHCSIGAFEDEGCPHGSEVGKTELTVFDGLTDLTVGGTVYELERPARLPLDFGLHVNPLKALIHPVHLLLEGHVDWEGDYHEYFEINNIPKEAELILGGKVPLSVIKSKLLFEGQKGGNFLTLPSVCSSTTTSYLEVESYEGAVARTQTHTPVGIEGWSSVPFKPTVTVSPETSTADVPDRSA